MVLRNKTELKIRYGTALFQGLIVGMAFYNIASREPILQLSFYFMILQMGTISNMAILPKLINARFVYKLEISDSLFGEAACICVNTLVNSTLAISSNFHHDDFVVFVFPFTVVGIRDAVLLVVAVFHRRDRLPARHRAAREIGRRGSADGYAFPPHHDSLQQLLHLTRLGNVFEISHLRLSHGVGC